MYLFPTFNQLKNFDVPFVFQTSDAMRKYRPVPSTSFCTPLSAYRFTRTPTYPACTVVVFIVVLLLFTVILPAMLSSGDPFIIIFGVISLIVFLSFLFYEIWSVILQPHSVRLYLHIDLHERQHILPVQ